MDGPQLSGMGWNTLRAKRRRFCDRYDRSMENQSKSAKPKVTPSVERLCAWALLIGLAIALRVQSFELALWSILISLILYDLTPYVLEGVEVKRTVGITVDLNPSPGINDLVPSSPPPDWRSLPESRRQWLRDRYSHRLETVPEDFEEWADSHVHAEPVEGGWELELVEVLYTRPPGQQN